MRLLKVYELVDVWVVLLVLFKHVGTVSQSLMHVLGGVEGLILSLSLFGTEESEASG